MATTNPIKNIEAKVNCTGCGYDFVLVGSYQSEKFSVEQCQHCHHAYTGKKTTQSTGESEKFNSKYKLDVTSLLG